jgi:hypothetical protein
MKKLILSIAAVVISTSMFANKDVEVSLCANTNSIKIKELRYCRELTLNNEKYKIFSFKLGFTKEMDGDSMYIEFGGVSEKIEDSFCENFKTYTPDKLYLEDVIVVNENNEKFMLENIVFEVTK